jgi:hypothetical protein
MWRGISAYDAAGNGYDLDRARGYADEFRSGELYAGEGVYGNGTYTAYGDERAQRVARNYTSGIGVGLRMALSPDANVWTLDEVQAAQRVALDEAEAALERAQQDLWQRTTTEADADLRVVIRKAQAYLDMISDPGRYAASIGVDAIRIDGVEYMVVLNRTAVLISDVTRTVRSGDEGFEWVLGG